MAENENETIARAEGDGFSEQEELQATGQGAEPTAERESIDELRDQLTRAQNEAAEYLDNWRRAAADLSNARKRMLREQAEFNASATARVLERVLPIVDDVDRAMELLPAEQANGDWADGFRLIQRKLQTLLENEGVTPIRTEGQMFDPALHFAVTHEEHKGYTEGQIIGEVARGYKLGDRVRRPSMVRVAKGNQES